MSFSIILNRLRVFFTPAWRQLALFALLHVIILTVWLNFSSFQIRIHPDVELYFEYADLIFTGNIPYQDFSVEYPPLAFLFLAIPRLFSVDLMGYADVFAVLMVAFDIAGLFFLSRITRITGLPHFKTLLIYTVAFYLLGDIVINRFDVIPAVMSLAAVYFYIAGKNKTAWLALALGVLAKIYPLVLAPLFAIPYLYRREYRPLCKGLAVFVLTGTVFSLPFLIASPAGFWDFVSFHSDRGLQLESGYASLLMLADMLGLTFVEVIRAPASVDLQAPGSDFLITASSYLAAAILCFCYWLYYKNIVKTGTSSRALIGYGLGITALLLVSTKIFSTQFVIWLYPLVPLVSGRLRHPAWISFGIIGLLSSYLYPHNYGQLMNLEQPAVIFLILRNTLVTAVGVALIWQTNHNHAAGTQAEGL